MARKVQAESRGAGGRPTYCCAVCGKGLSLWDAVLTFDGERVCGDGECMGNGILAARKTGRHGMERCGGCGRADPHGCTGTSCDECRAERVEETAGCGSWFDLPE